MRASECVHDTDVLATVGPVCTPDEAALSPAGPASFDDFLAGSDADCEDLLAAVDTAELVDSPKSLKSAQTSSTNKSTKAKPVKQSNEIRPTKLAKPVAKAKPAVGSKKAASKKGAGLVGTQGAGPVKTSKKLLARLNCSSVLLLCC